MKKNNDVLLKTILGGAIACFICIAMVFIFPSKSTKKYDSVKTNLPSQNNKANNIISPDQNSYVEEELLLGDECNDCTAWNSWSCTSNNDQHTGSTPSGCSSTPPTSGTRYTKCVVTGSDSTGAIWHTETCTRTCKTYSCSSCDAGKYLTSSNKCEPCPAGSYCSGSEKIACPAGKSSVPGSTMPSDCITCSPGSISAAGGICTICSEPGTTSNWNHTECIDRVISRCEAGEYLGSEACEPCPNGYTSAAGNFYINNCYVDVSPGYEVKSAHAASTACAANYYQSSSKRVYYGESYTCTPCSDGYSANSTKTGCVRTSCPAGKYLDSSHSTGCSDCPSGKYCTGGTAMPASCTDGKVPNETRDGCISTGCPEGQGKDSYATTGCSNCAAGYWSGDNDDVCHKCTNGNLSNAAAKSCDIPVTSPCCVRESTGSYTPINDDSGCKQAAMGGADVRLGACPSTGKCTISISNVSVKTSVDSDNVQNSYYTVVVTIDGDDCKGQTATFSATNAKSVTPTTYTVASDLDGTRRVSFTVKPSKACVPSTPSATLSNGSSSTGKSVTILSDWTKTTSCEKNPIHTTFSSADAAGDDVYYSSYGTCSDGVSQGWTLKWTRGGCGGSSSTPKSPTTPGATPTSPPANPTPTVPATPENIPHCYENDEGEYVWTNTPEPSWKEVEGVTSIDYCVKEEKEACYIDPTGEYVWGKYGKTDGYTLISSIVDSKACAKPTEEYACYKSEDGDYLWTKYPPDNYKKVDGVTKPEDCGEKESPACYIHISDGKFVWGTYGKITGYIVLEDVTDEDECKVPDTDACYIDEDGNYVWGKYGDDPSYRIVLSVTDISQCRNTPDVPKTDMDVSKIVYIFMGILMVCGIGFICYSSVNKNNY